MEPPSEFAEELRAWLERLDWLWDSLASGGPDLGKSRAVLDEFHEFYERWHPRLPDGEDRRKLESLRRDCFAPLEQNYQDLFWVRLNLVIAAHVAWQASESSYQATVTWLGNVRRAPPETRAEFEQDYLRRKGKPLQPAALYHAAESRLAQAEPEARGLLEGMVLAWPERVTPALRERLAKLDADDLAAWRAEVAAKVAGLAPVGESPVESEPRGGTAA